MKLDFIYGRFTKSDDPFELAKWERCNSAVLTWITHSVSKEIGASIVHMEDASQAWIDLETRFGSSNGPMIFAIQEEIHSLKQGDSNVAGYYNRLVMLWEEEDAATKHDLCELGGKCISSRCMLSKKEIDRAMKFLIGLNEIHFQIRSQILAMDPLPNLAKIYNMVRRDEKQQGIQRTTYQGAFAMYAGQTTTNNNSHGPTQQRFNNYKENNNSSHDSGQQNNKQSSKGLQGTGPSNNINNYQDKQKLFCTHCEDIQKKCVSEYMATRQETGLTKEMLVIITEIPNSRKQSMNKMWDHITHYVVPHITFTPNSADQRGIPVTINE